MGDSVPSNVNTRETPYFITAIGKFRVIFFPQVIGWLAKLPPMAICTVLHGCVCASIALPTIPPADYPFVCSEAGTKISNTCIKITLHPMAAIDWQATVGRQISGTVSFYSRVDRDELHR